ncbi:SLC8A2 [Symbiodinium sp. CCMP2592]|nr:SLC8A2 [Symbiodinium sp. CCMP2592]
MGNGFFAGELGPSTIVGSAAFNLFCIVAVCVVAVPAGEQRQIKDLGVFWVTAGFSIFAYLWLVVIVQVNSPNVVELWEALLTLAWLPVLITVSYLTDIGWFSGIRRQPVIEKPVALASDGKAPLATLAEPGARSRMVWRHALKRSRDYPELPEEGSETSGSLQSDECSLGFRDPGVILNEKGVPYENDAGIITFFDDSFNVSSGLEGRCSGFIVTSLARWTNHEQP